MLVSALLTSVGINLGICILFFTLYSILRKQPGNIHVYAPRLIAEGKSVLSDHFNIESLLPSAGWVQRAWQPSEEDLLSTSGLDAVVLIRVFIFSLRVFSFAGIIGIFILLPVNYSGSQLSIDFSDLPNESVDIFSISNVDNGSKRLWIHFCAVYVFTGVVCFLLYYEYKHISSKRITYFYASKPQPHQFTLLVSGIPSSAGKSFNDSVESFFTEFHPITYLSHIMVRRTNKIRNLIRDGNRLYKRLVNLKSKDPAHKKYTRDGFLGLFGRKVDLVDHHEKKLEDLEDNVRMEQLSVSLTGEELPAAFVSFKSRYGAAVALHIQQSTNPTEWVMEQAPEPHDVYWPFFSASFMQRWVFKLVVFVACFILTLLFLIPVVFVQGLTNLQQLETYMPFLKGILTITFVSEIITGYLPSLILQLFLKVVPPIMKILSSMQGHISNSRILMSACKKVLWFTIWNIFFANVLSGSALSQFSIILDPKTIPEKLAVAVPAQASFFIAYVVTSGWSGISSELFRMIPLICDFIRRHCSCSSDDEFVVPSIPYHSEIAKILFFGLLGITYFFLAPLILPFLLVYYCLGYIIYRNQFLNVYEPKFETGGKFWPIVHTSTIFSLILMHILAVGLFALKELPLASSLCIPLPIVTLLFNDYCRKRFLPIFAAYPAECLIKKDREDQNDAAMTEFLDKLVTAYLDPSLLPMQNSSDVEGYHSPLLHSRDV
ncbi:CSC1-like protein HYP1 [Macadamia integrifolia]|uniref:CSC1-like protein HYP1 n=1 Tax=Macadamia integrifolia TaxID=60698 RepID=UPI001C4E7609|nr:CSC1-like protein HYP1 [Macadamia integrifolia]XP_042500250.1 CSC1-like protein HYP1 [Macadamia integrifolia]XP_042500251.1 CSC1-like protein HYP1 [Macadamia integrifolia]